MPRIYDSHGDPLDFCKDCFPWDEEEAENEYRDGNFERSQEGIDWLNDGNGGWGYYASHPSYDDTDYLCEVCCRALHAIDDGEEAY